MAPGRGEAGNWSKYFNRAASHSIQSSVPVASYDVGNVNCKSSFLCAIVEDRGVLITLHWFLITKYSWILGEDCLHKYIA